MSDEVLEWTTKLWTSSAPVSFDGSYVGKDLVVDPKPLQKPYPELWWAGEAAPSIRRAAKYARYLELAWIPSGRIRSHYGPALQEANRGEGGHSEIAIFLPVTITDKALTRGEVSSMYYDWGDEMLSVIAVGNPAQCASVIRDYRNAGVTHFALDLHRHGLDSVSSIHDQLDRFATEVVPLL
jgi:alkanesulfonate monooxygenase SsuD/methylene tetrahydromethanopterin reductase-like flavin-dependent oxidoreductase (luciferase family)